MPMGQSEAPPWVVMKKGAHCPEGAKRTIHCCRESFVRPLQGNVSEFHHYPGRRFATYRRCALPWARLLLPHAGRIAKANPNYLRARRARYAIARRARYAIARRAGYAIARRAGYAIARRAGYAIARRANGFDSPTGLQNLAQGRAKRRPGSS